MTVISAQNLDLTFQTGDGPVQALRDVSTAPIPAGWAKAHVSRTAWALARPTPSRTGAPA